MLEQIDEKIVRVWQLTSGGRPMRVATIEQRGRKTAPCHNCAAPCCRGSLLPVINEAELRANRFPIQFVPAPEWLTDQVPRAERIAVLRMGKEGCDYFDRGHNFCSIYPLCPESCLSYDCREDERMSEIWRTGHLSKEVVISMVGG